MRMFISRSWLMAFTAGSSLILASAGAHAQSSYQDREHAQYEQRQRDNDSRYYAPSTTPEISFGDIKWPKDEPPVPLIAIHRTPSAYDIADYNKRAAENGDVGGMRNYGLALLNGYGARENKPEAYTWFEKAAPSDPVSEFWQSYMLVMGDGVPMDRAKGMTLMRDAADRGEAHALDVLGGNTEKFESDVERTAASGNYAPMTQFAVKLLRGDDGFKIDQQKAFAYFKQAAEAGFTRAQCYLGLMYQRGYAVPVDRAEALRWYLKADANKDLGASGFIVMWYLEDSAFSADQILPWGLKTVTQNPTYAEGYVDLARIYGRQKNMTAAFDALKKAADLGSLDGLTAVGQYEWKGLAGPKDPVNGLKHLQDAAAKGSRQANYELGMAYRGGENGLPVDHNKAFGYLTAAAKAGDDRGKGALAVAYLEGSGVAQSNREAANWAREPASRGQSSSLYVMARLTAAGFEGPKDPVLALDMMKRAAAGGSTSAIKAMAAGFDGSTNN